MCIVFIMKTIEKFQLNDSFFLRGEKQNYSREHFMNVLRVKFAKTVENLKNGTFELNS